MVGFLVKATDDSTIYHQLIYLGVFYLNVSVQYSKFEKALSQIPNPYKIYLSL